MKSRADTNKLDLFSFFVFQSNVTLRQLAELREKSQEWMNQSPLFMNSFHLLNQTIPMLQVGEGSDTHYCMSYNSLRF